MRKRGEIKRERIIIYYILAIVLPCLILGVLAFRGIKNDQALVEREHRNKLAETSQDIIQEIDTFLSTVESNFIKILDSVTSPRRIIYANSQLNQFIIQHKMVAGIFFVPELGSPKLFNSGLLYIPDNTTTAPDQTSFQTMQRIHKNGWQYEYVQKNYKKALEYYQSILPQAQEEHSIGEILNIIARIQKKLELKDEAIKTYDLIWNKYPMVFIQNRVPLGAVALLEKSSICLKKSDSSSALTNIRILLNQIQYSTWEIEFSYYDLILSQADIIISECENSNNPDIELQLEKIRLIKEGIAISQIRTEYLLSFLQNSELILNKPELVYTNSFYRKKDQINDESYFLSIHEAKNNYKWGFIIDTDCLLTSIIHPLLIEKAKEFNFNWIVIDENGGILLSSEFYPENILSVFSAFPSNLPSFAFKLYPEKTGLLGSFFNSREGLFLYIFIVITIILVFGLVFTLRTIDNEIQFSKMKSYFMSTVSHEFKSPLTSIRQMAEMLVHGRVPSTERKKKYYNVILLQSERLSHLIENILDFSKMEGNQKVFRFEKENIVPLIKEVIAAFKNNMTDKGLKVHFSNSESIPDILFDKEAIEQVMYNLLDNAYKYSGESKTIEIEITTKGRHAIISISDFGVGISKKDKDKIFDRFYRVGDELTQSVKGSGIGLTIVKQIITAHKGKINVQSEPGKGSTFSIVLPTA